MTVSSTARHDVAAVRKRRARSWAAAAADGCEFELLIGFVGYREQDDECAPCPQHRTDTAPDPAPDPGPTTAPARAPRAAI